MNNKLYVDGKLNPEFDVPIIYWCQCETRDKGYTAGTLVSRDESMKSDVVVCNICKGLVSQEPWIDQPKEWDDEEN